MRVKWSVIRLGICCDVGSYQVPDRGRISTGMLPILRTQLIIGFVMVWAFFGMEILGPPPC